MKLTVALPPDDAARLPRLKLLTGLRSGRRNQRAVAITWHDTDDLALAEQGLALAEQGRRWRLERLAGQDQTWPVAPEPLADATSPQRLGHPLPIALHAVAGFDGQAVRQQLTMDGATVAMELLRGTIGWARRRQPACRLTLDGDADRVLDLALRLAGELDVTIPPQCLASEALAVATRVPRPAPPPAGLHRGLAVADAFVLALGRHSQAIQQEAAAIAGGSSDIEAVHRARVAVRRLRSTIAVFRPVVFCPLADATNQGLKALADRLAPARDLDVFVAETTATVGDVIPDDAGLRRLRSTADRRRRAAYAALREWLQGRDFQRLMLMLAGLADGGTWRGTEDPERQALLAQPLETFAGQARKRRYRRLTEAGETIDHLDPAALHIVRLRAKRMRYAAEVFAPLFARKATQRFLRRLSALQDRLGTLNDSAVADSLLAALGPGTDRAHAAGLIRGFLAARADGARSRIARAWRRLRRLEPFWA